MPLIVALAMAVSLAALAFAAAGPAPLAHSLRRVRLARGVTREGLRERLRETPFIRQWRPVDHETLRLAEVGALNPADLALAKLAAAAIAVLVAFAFALPAIALAPLAFVAFVAPSEWARRRAEGRIRSRREAVLPFVERVVALASAGVPVEQAVLRAADATSPLAALLAQVRARAELGVPPLDALGEIADRERALELRDLARELARARRGGRPLQPVLAERRETLRLAYRAERLDAASRVDGALSLVLVLAYLPALLLLVVVPLFLGLLRSLGD